MDSDTLYILWTTADPHTSKNMVMMYAKNAMIHGWWKHVTVCVWGASSKYLAEDPDIQELFLDAKEAGVVFDGCITCALNEGVVEKLQELGVDLHGWGRDLTQHIKEKANLICI